MEQCLPALAFLINLLAGTNYGYLNHKPDHPSLMDVLGPWPLYLLSLQAIALLFFALLLLPFRRRWRGCPSHGGGCQSISASLRK